MARHPGPLRTHSSVSLTGALVLLLGLPLCAEEVCPTDEAAAKAAREEPGTHWLSGVPEPHNPVPAPPPGPAITAAVSAADTPTPSPVRNHPASGTEAAPAATRGVGFFNLPAQQA